MLPVKEKDKKIKKILEKFRFFNLLHPPAINECPQKISAQSVQPFGRLYATYIRMSCFIIQIFYTILIISGMFKMISI